MKWFRDGALRKVSAAIATAALASVCAVKAGSLLPPWFQNAEANSAIESALYRLLPLPGAQALFPRAPRESRPALGALIAKTPDDASLYSLRALEDERGLDFAAAESDWKAYVRRSADPVAANLDLADYYSRRLQPTDEIATLNAVGKLPTPASESLMPVGQQSSWMAYERVLALIERDALPPEMAMGEYREWIARYPHEASIYVRYDGFLLEQKRFDDAEKLIGDYKAAFPGDVAFPVKAEALLKYRQGSIAQGLEVYDKAFEPLWPAELVQGYFGLLKESRSDRQALDRWHAALTANPDDLNDLARIFYSYQQQGRLDAAKLAIDQFRESKEKRGVAWKGAELYTLARLLDDVHAYSEATRYYFALYNTHDMPEAQERALSGITSILLTAPEEPLRIGAGDLSMYKDIATLDNGPGYLNGILSLLLNTSNPSQQLADEEQLAVPYFHRARAAELLAMLDSKFPQSPSRPELHAQLIEAYATYGEDQAVIQAAKGFLADFPTDARHVRVALMMADAYARTKNQQDEFAVYDSLLKELAKNAHGVPLGGVPDDQPTHRRAFSPVSADGESSFGANAEEESENPPPPQPGGGAFDIQSAPGNARPATGTSPDDYRSILDRYLGRLVAAKQVPKALAVLRGELDRNPDDPGIYERLADFLAENRLGSEQEQVYQKAIEKFQSRSWYDKLARFYLRQKQQAQFVTLTEQVVKIFSGTDLDRYFANVTGSAPQISLQLNLYAHQRFPHDLTFVRNLLYAYRVKETADPAAWETLLRQHWFEDDDLRGQFFEYLSKSGKLAAELAQLEKDNQEIEKTDWAGMAKTNPGAERFYAEAGIWRSHFEDAAPAIGALSAEYPSDFALGRESSSLFRSLAYFDSRQTGAAVAVEQRLLRSDPGNLDILARIGDIYADRDQFAKAAPYWLKIPEVHPGEADGYLQSATIFWDYFDFDGALRQLNKARQKLGNPSLYAYQEGAIYENRKDYSRAIEQYVSASVTDSPGSEARQRLITLAGRAGTRTAVDEATAKLIAGAEPTLAQIHLRVDVLDAQRRRSDIEKVLTDLADRTSSFDVLEDIESLSQQKSLESPREHALQRQIALTTDPTRRLELGYDLVRYYEGNKDLKNARERVEALYRDNPKILGVVRATVDFDWRNDSKPQAVQVLLDAAHSAYPDLANQFQLEAASKSTELGDYAKARTLLAQLLQSKPYDSTYLAAMGETYGRAGDDAGLRDFYQTGIKGFQHARLDPAERKSDIAGLRRGLIPALGRLQEFTEATDQYIELINAYPDDDGLTAEAADFAQRHGQQQRLLDFYTKTVTDSPRDSRWAVVLARLQTSFENYPGAIDAYGKAIVIRPDRRDLYTARAELESRLARFDDAIVDYEKLYALAYKDPSWMEKVAETRARQGKRDLAVQALQTALIENRPVEAKNYFEAARQLESWGLLPEALAFAKKGVDVAGNDLLAEAENHAGAAIYAAILTRMRQQARAFTELQAALEVAKHSPDSPEAIAQQAEAQGIAAVTDREWRVRKQQLREQEARIGLALVFDAMGKAVNDYFTPEEKLGFRNDLETLSKGKSREDLTGFYLPLAVSAGLPDLEASYRQELLENDPRTSLAELQPLAQLQTRRMKLNEFGTEMLKYSAAVSPRMRPQVLSSAADAFHKDGDQANELRVLELKNRGWTLSGDEQQRFYSLLLSRNPSELVDMAADKKRGDAATQYVVIHGEDALALSAVERRSSGEQPVWRSAYVSLVGLFLSDKQPQIGEAFLAALGDQAIGERIGHPVDLNRQLAGDRWFYYGSRYGEYLSLLRKENADDYLPATLELNPASATVYEGLAAFDAEKGDVGAALQRYQNALDLAPVRPDIYDKMALLKWQQGQQAEALNDWKQAISLLAKQVDIWRVPDSLWVDFDHVVSHLGARKLFPEVRPQVDSLLKAYVSRNGNYEVVQLLHPAFVAVNNPDDATRWMLEIVNSAQRPDEILAGIVDAKWLPMSQKAPVYERLLELAGNRASRSEGQEGQQAHSELAQLQLRWAGYLVESGDDRRAQGVLDAMTSEDQKQYLEQRTPLQVRIAAHENRLPQLIESYTASPQDAPQEQGLKVAAEQLQKAGDKKSAQAILEFVYQRALDARELTAPNFLGLAEVYLEEGDTEKALALLRRMVLVAGDTYENLESAASLLSSHDHDADASPFLTQLVRGVPWDVKFRIQLAKAQLKAGQDKDAAVQSLAAVAASQESPYDLRANAAAALAGSHNSATLGSDELRILSQGKVETPREADKPYFYGARKLAAQGSFPATGRIALLRSGIADEPQRDDLRIALFKVALSEKSYSVAVAAVAPLLQRGYQRNAYDSGDSEATEPEQADEHNEQADFVLSGVPAGDRQMVATGLGVAFQELHDHDQALQFTRIALQHEKDATQKKTLSARASLLQGILKRRAANAQRAPQIHDALEQDHVVRPRLTARGGGPPNENTEGARP